jgi:hypothetical protein
VDLVEGKDYQIAPQNDIKETVYRRAIVRGVLIKGLEQCIKDEPAIIMLIISRCFYINKDK